MDAPPEPSETPTVVHAPPVLPEAPAAETETPVAETETPTVEGWATLIGYIVNSSQRTANTKELINELGLYISVGLASVLGFLAVVIWQTKPDLQLLSHFLIAMASIILIAAMPKRLARFARRWLAKNKNEEEEK